jgi:hypothetical protein
MASLRQYIEQVLEGSKIPPKPAPYSIQAQRKRHNAAVTIQNFYFARMIQRSEQ